jgi:hypothetical protein
MMIEDGQKTDEIVCLEGEKEAKVEAEESAGSVSNDDVGFELVDDNACVKNETLDAITTEEPSDNGDINVGCIRKVRL